MLYIQCIGRAIYDVADVTTTTLPHPGFREVSLCVSFSLCVSIHCHKLNFENGIHHYKSKYHVTQADPNDFYLQALCKHGI